MLSSPRRAGLVAPAVLSSVLLTACGGGSAPGAAAQDRTEPTAPPSPACTPAPLEARAAAVLHDADLDMLATNDVFWDEIVEVQDLGAQEVFDATVDGVHNFVADGVIVHNSIEQDADMVILLHRPDAFERDDPRAGEADLILAKHRNGPTSTITVAHQLHYSRFADLAHG